jgi:hypothetical protein
MREPTQPCGVRTEQGGDIGPIWDHRRIHIAGIDVRFKPACERPEDLLCSPL